MSLEYVLIKVDKFFFMRLEYVLMTILDLIANTCPSIFYVLVS